MITATQFTRLTCSFVALVCSISIGRSKKEPMYKASGEANVAGGESKAAKLPENGLRSPRPLYFTVSLSSLSPGVQINAPVN